MEIKTIIVLHSFIAIVFLFVLCLNMEHTPFPLQQVFSPLEGQTLLVRLLKTKVRLSQGDKTETIRKKKGKPL